MSLEVEASRQIEAEGHSPRERQRRVAHCRQEAAEVEDAMASGTKRTCPARHAHGEAQHRNDVCHRRSDNGVVEDDVHGLVEHRSLVRVVVQNPV